jgi:hypothetical protein
MAEANQVTPAADTCGRCGQPGLAHVVHTCTIEAPPPTRVFESPIEARLQFQIDDLLKRVEALEQKR